MRPSRTAPLWAVIKQEDSEGEGAIFLDKYATRVDAAVQKPRPAGPPFFAKFGSRHMRAAAQFSAAAA